MDSTAMRSPPTSAASEARSSVAVMTLSLPAASQTPVAARNTVVTTRCLRVREIFLESILLSGLKRVRSMGADGKLELEQELVGSQVLAILRAPELAADLAELAGPIGNHQ